jgi:hypothetical protein
LSDNVTWPDHLVDATRLFAEIAKELGATPGLPPNHRIYDRAYTIEQFIDEMRRKGKIKRYVYKDPDTGEPKAFGYDRSDIRKMIQQASGAGQL